MKATCSCGATLETPIPALETASHAVPSDRDMQMRLDWNDFFLSHGRHQQPSTAVFVIEQREGADQMRTVGGAVRDLQDRGHGWRVERVRLDRATKTHQKRKALLGTAAHRSPTY